MRKEKLNHYRLLLLEKRKFIEDNIERLKEISQIKDQESDSGKKYGDHPADEGSNSMGKEEAFMLISRELIYLHQINRALTSIDENSYGVCRVCGMEIPPERLEAVPTTETCIECKNRQIKKISLD